MEITLNTDKIHISTGGKAFDPALPTVLFLHGSGGDHRTFAEQTRWFAYHGFSVLAPDFPGHSLSGGEALKSIEETGPWLRDLLEEVGVKRVHVAGHSQGSLSAFELARIAPGTVKTLTVIASAAAIPVNQALIDTALKSSDKAAQMMCNWGFGPGAHMGQSAVPGMQPIAISRSIMSRNPLAVDLQACADYNAGADIAESFDVPALCILASEDKMTPLKAGKALASSLKAKTVIVENYGHMLPLEAPKQTLSAMADFIQSQETKG